MLELVSEDRDLIDEEYEQGWDILHGKKRDELSVLRQTDISHLYAFGQKILQNEAEIKQLRVQLEKLEMENAALDDTLQAVRQGIIV